MILAGALVCKMLSVRLPHDVQVKYVDFVVLAWLKYEKFQTRIVSEFSFFKSFIYADLNSFHILLFNWCRINFWLATVNAAKHKKKNIGYGSAAVCKNPAGIQTTESQKALWSLLCSDLNILFSVLCRACCDFSAFGIGHKIFISRTAHVCSESLS